jgi:serine/threonine-protein kinase RsbW
MRSGLMPGDQNGLDERDEQLRTGGDVRLVVPAAPEYLRLVRLTAAGMASRLGFTFDEVEDLRIAVDELCFHLLGEDDVIRSDDERTMDLVYSADTDSITITGRTALSGAVPQQSELSEQILDALVDEHEVTGGTNGTVTFRLMKQRES